MDRLYTSLSGVRSIECDAHGCTRRVVAPPGSPMVFCASHRNNAAPEFGWFWVSQEEYQTALAMRDTRRETERLALEMEHLGVAETGEAPMAVEELDSSGESSGDEI